MPRSVADATRFTAASPHVYAKPSPVRPTPSSSTYSSLRPSQPKPKPGSSTGSRKETPHEKVARLRALRTAERHAQLPLWERTVIRGRVIADRAHRFTAYSLIIFSVIAVGFSAFAITDMLLHNRRKRSAFYDQQHRIYTSKLLAAIETEKAGLPLTNDQQLVLNRERLKIAEEDRKKEQSWSTKTKRFFTGGLKKVDDSALRRGDADAVQFDGGRIPTEGEVLELLGVDKLETLKEAEGKHEKSLETQKQGHEIEQDIDTKMEKQVLGVTARQGGVLDQMAENVFRRATGK